MPLNFSLSKITPQLTNERLRGYKWILVGQLFIMINFLFIYELFTQYPFAHWQQMLVIIIGLVMLAMNVLTYELIKDLTENKLIQRTVFYLLVTGVGLGMITGIGLIDKSNFLYNLLTVISISFSLFSFLILLYFMVYDIFNEKHDITYRLWGSASVYMLIGAVFGLTYSLLGVMIPSQFQFTTEIDLFRFIPCYNFSFYTLAGIDSPFENFGILIKNISVIESIFSNLYIVLVVGRLLSK